MPIDYKCGEDIGGAKKELYTILKERELTYADFLNLQDKMDDSDCELYIKKKNFWIIRADTYKEMIEAGVAKEYIYLTYILYNKMQNKVSVQKNYKVLCEKYIRGLEAVKKALVTLYKQKYNPEDLKIWFKNFVLSEGYFTTEANGKSLKVTDKAVELYLLFGVKGLASLLGQNIFEDEIIQVSLSAMGYPQTFDTRFLTLTYRRFKNPKTVIYMIVDKPMTVLGKKLKKKSILYNRVYKEGEEYNLKASTDEIFKFFEIIREKEKGIESPSNSKEKKTINKKENLEVRPQLKHINRTGVDIRKLKDISSEDLLKRYGFRGLEFGNYQTQKDRQACLNYAYDALNDLAYCLNIPQCYIGMSFTEDMRQLAIAFGARGGGRAAAHYERIKHVINLTKLRGAGSLAHEMGHALDSSILKYCSADTEHKLSTEYVYDLVSNKKYKEIEAQTNQIKRLLKAILGVCVSIYFKEDYLIEKGIDILDVDFEVVSELYRKYFYNIKNRTEYYNFSVFCDKTKVYYSTITELFARAFETYIENKLHYASQYLVYGTNRTIKGSDGTIKSIYPQNTELETIIKAMDNLIKVLKDVFNIGNFDTEGLDYSQVTETSQYIIEYAKKTEGVKLKENVKTENIASKNESKEDIGIKKPKEPPKQKLQDLKPKKPENVKEENTISKNESKEDVSIKKPKESPKQKSQELKPKKIGKSKPNSMDIKTTNRMLLKKYYINYDEILKEVKRHLKEEFGLHTEVVTTFLNLVWYDFSTNSLQATNMLPYQTNVKNMDDFIDTVLFTIRAYSLQKTQEYLTLDFGYVEEEPRLLLTTEDSIVYVIVGAV